jgi:hypothetical protein
MRYLVTLMLVVIAAIHLLPAIGMTGTERLTALYGVTVSDPNLAILLRHRAVMFAIFGIFFAVAAFVPSWQGLALTLAFVSVLSFILLAHAIGGYNAQLARVYLVDLVALACIAVGAGALVWSTQTK